MDRFIRIVHNIVFISTILILVRVLFVSSFPVNDGYNMAATLYLGKVTWVVVAASLVIAFINRRFYRIGWVDLMVFALVLLLYFNSNSLPLYKEQALLILSLYYAVRLLYSLVEYAKYILPAVLIITLAAQLYIAYSQLFGNAASNHALFAFTGSFENPGPFSGFVAMLLPLATVVAFSKERFSGSVNSLKWGETVVKFGALVVVVAALAIVAGGGSRGALIATVVGGIVLYWKRSFITSIREWYSCHKVLGISLFVAGVALFVLAAYLLFMVKADSAMGRVVLWICSIKTILQNPFWGAGLGRFTACYGEVQSEFLSGRGFTDVFVRVADVPQFAFNELLHFGIEGGVVAMLLLAGIVVCAIYGALRSGKYIAKVYGSALVVLTLFSMVSYPLHVLPFLTIAVLLLAATVSEYEQGTGRYYDRAMIGIVLLVCSFLVWRNPYYKEERIVEWSRERHYYNMDIFRTTVDNYGMLLPDFRDNYAFLFEYGRALAQTEQYALSDSILTLGLQYSKDPMFLNLLGKNAVARGNFNSAEQYFKQSVTLLPNRHYPLYLLFDMYLQKGDTLNARIWGERVLNQPPKVNSKFIQEKQSEVRSRLK